MTIDVRAIRLKAEMTQIELADYLDVTQGAVTAYEGGRAKPAQRVHDLLTALDADPTLGQRSTSSRNRPRGSKNGKTTRKKGSKKDPRKINKRKRRGPYKVEDEGAGADDAQSAG